MSDERIEVTLYRLALLCRVGFEPDLIEELRAWFAARGASAQIDSTQEAVVRVDAASLVPRLTELIFARDILLVHAELSGLNVKDRVTPISHALQQMGPYTQLSLLTPDSEATKPLAPLVSALEARLRSTVSAADAAGVQAAVWLLSGTHALIGQAPAGGGAAFLGGIPRLKFPRDAPSRSTLKLDEAFQVLLSDAERRALLRANGSAVDLGAAPGGWTYQLVMRQMRVTAIDNARMDARLMESGRVTHLREDGFRYRPNKPVDWLVCDMVEQPGRVAELVARWFNSGWCSAAIFNLKLPMKRRFDAWMSARAVLDPLLKKAYVVRARQLYHDREEITVAVLPSALGARRGADQQIPAAAKLAARPKNISLARPAPRSAPRAEDKSTARKKAAPKAKAAATVGRTTRGDQRPAARRKAVPGGRR